MSVQHEGGDISTRIGTNRSGLVVGCAGHGSAGQVEDHREAEGMKDVVDVRRDVEELNASTAGAPALKGEAGEGADEGTIDTFALAEINKNAQAGLG